MNELIFVAHAVTIIVCTFIATRLGKSGLAALIALFAVLANLFVTKQITLFGLNATAADAYIVGASLTLNLLQEFFGRASARKAIWLSFFIALAYTIMTQFHLSYHASPFDTNQAHFWAILHPMPRLIIASLTAYLMAEWLNYRIFSLLKKNIPAAPFAVRSFTATAASQLIDTLLFSFLGLYGILSALGNVIMVSYSIKLITIFLATPFLSFAKKFIKTN